MECLNIDDNLVGSKVIWVVSYPKSGNTWVRFLLANLLCGPINNSQQMEQIILDIHKDYLGDWFRFGEVVFLKTHWKYEMVSSLNFKTIGAIYICRNPLDIIASHINYFRYADDRYKKNNFIDQFINSCGVRKWINLDMGTWTENIESWIFHKKNFPCLVLRYEDMKIKPLEAAIKICQFAGIHKTDLEIRQAIKQSTFENLRSMEERELNSGTNGFFLYEYQVKKDSNYRFMNKGETGNFRQLLSHEQIKRVINRFSTIMEMLGYTIKETDYIC